MRYKIGKFPKACKDCNYLGRAMVYMDGTAAYSCCNPKANLLYFSKGVSCKEGEHGRGTTKKEVK